jgi:uncharacterized repeat protein (TIGR03803 family)
MTSRESETMNKAGDMALQTTCWDQEMGFLPWLVTMAIVLLPLIGSRAAAQAPVTSYSVLYNFTGGPDGAWPSSGPLVQDMAGNLYGTTSYGCGVVYKLSSDGTESALHNLNCHSDGAAPLNSVIISGNTLYGTAEYGGGAGNGALFAVDIPTGVETVLYNFQAGAAGKFPSSGLVQDNAGNLYGCALRGGREDHGVIYKFSLSTNTYTELYKFTGGVDGDGPLGNLTLDATGTVLYGTTWLGGASGFGVIFSLALQTGGYSVLHSFTGGPDGAYPSGSLIVGKGGVLLGTTPGGGSVASNRGLGYGVVFALFPTTGKETVLYIFTGGADGGEPEGVVLTKSGELVGTTVDGGASGLGTIFEVDPKAKTETVLHSFDGTDGEFPSSGLFQDSEGNFYGTTSVGGSRNFGVIFKLTPSGVNPQRRAPRQ